MQEKPVAKKSPLLVRLIILVVVVIVGVILGQTVIGALVNRLPDFALFTSDAGKFSAMVRGTPAETSKDVDIGNGAKSTLHQFQSLPPNENYTIIYQDFTQAQVSAYPDANAALADVAKAYTSTFTVQSTKNVTLGNVPGLQLVGDDGKSVKIQIQIYLAGTRLYIVQFNGTLNSFPQDDADKFASSFTIKT